MRLDGTAPNGRAASQESGARKFNNTHIYAPHLNCLCTMVNCEVILYCKLNSTIYTGATIRNESIEFKWNWNCHDVACVSMKCKFSTNMPTKGKNQKIARNRSRMLCSSPVRSRIKCNKTQNTMRKRINCLNKSKKKTHSHWYEERSTDRSNIRMMIFRWRLIKSVGISGCYCVTISTGYNTMDS